MECAGFRYVSTLGAFLPRLAGPLPAHIEDVIAGFVKVSPPVPTPCAGMFCLVKFETCPVRSTAATELLPIFSFVFFHKF
jgi:hypothetical protein